MESARDHLPGGTLAPFSWLHLSDLHLGPRGSWLLLPDYREALERDLRRLHARTGPWDAVFITGDLSESGRERDFELLDSYLNSLWEYFRSLGSNPSLFAVPGPSDFWRGHPSWKGDAARYPVSAIRKALQLSETNLIEQRIRGGFSPFSNWLGSWQRAHPSSALQGLRGGLLPGDFAATLTTNGRSVGVIGLNSIFRNFGVAGVEMTYDLDLSQIERATPMGIHPWAEQHDLVVLLTHYPPDLLNARVLGELRRQLSPGNEPLLHLCGSRDIWPSATSASGRAHSSQARSLFGSTLSKASDWGYTAGRITDSELQLFPRVAQSVEVAFTLGPDPLAGPDEALTTPLVPPEKDPPETTPLDSSVPPRLRISVNPQPSTPLPRGVVVRAMVSTGTHHIAGLAWAPGGEALAIGHSDGHLSYWQVKEETPRWTISAHVTGITDLCFSPEGQTVATRSRHHARLWGLDGARRPIPDLVIESGAAFAWSSQGLLAALDAMGDLWVWSSATWDPVEPGPSTLPYSAIYCLSWSPDGRTLACGTTAGVILLHWLEGQEASGSPKLAPQRLNIRTPVHDIAWMPTSRVLALASLEGRIYIWDRRQPQAVAVLEGHTDAVTSVSFSFDGRLLASKALDETIRLWRTDTWEPVASFADSASSLVSGDLAFSPSQHVLASIGSSGRGIHLWGLDVEALLGAPAPSTIIHEVSAKVVLVGEAREGKSSLALRMVQDQFEELDSTHGMRFWSMPAGPPLEKAAAWNWRELILWDMGGQSEYQLVHQLFLRDSTAALLVMEPGRGEAALRTAEAWNQRLMAQTGGRKLRKLLVGSKMDSLEAPVNLPAVQELVQRGDFTTYVSTSARTGQGISELKKALNQAIDWDSLEKVSRPELFQRMRQHIRQLRDSKRMVLTFSELEDELRREMGSAFDPEVVRAVVGQLARQGFVADTRMADGTRVLVLEIEQVERYAGSLIITARDNPHGVAALDLAKVLSPAMRFPRIKPEERLRRDQEVIVLECVIELLLEHGLCLRHEGLLIFPSLFRPTQAEAATSFPHAISLHYDFSGPIDNIYASLVTSVAISQRFGPLRLWEDRAEFGRAGTDSCGVRRVRRGGQDSRGYARLELYFDSEAPESTRDLFVNFVEQHLHQHGVELLEQLTITCVCGRVFAEDIVRERIEAGKADICCSACDVRTPLTLGAQQARERNPELLEQLQALRTNIREQRSQDLTGMKVSIAEATKASPSQSEPLRILHLSDLHVRAGDDPLSLLQPLMADLRDRREGLGVERLDYLVLSGDITNRAAPEEFEKARELVSALIGEFGLTSERCIIVPGNHDLDWDTEVYIRKKRRQVGTSRLEPGMFIEDGDGYYLRDKERYPERFKNFSQHFYHPLLQKPYPLAPEEQCIPSLFSESRLLFLGMNSAWEIDEYFQDRATISEQALSRGLAQATQALAEARARRELTEDAPVLGICVWHHPITGNEKIQADAFIGRLLQADARICLHGHVHEDRADLINYLHPGRRLHVVGAGSFGAPAHHRPESVPRLFNLLEVQRDLRRFRVHTRCLRKQGGAWEGWAVWPGEKPGEKRSHYDVMLP